MGAARYKPYPAYQDSGVEWSEEFPDEWEATRFKNLFTIKKRIAGKIGPDVLSITQKGIKVKDLESGEGQLASDYSKYQHVYAGDFAMNHMDLLTGYVDISKYDGVTSPDYRVFSLDRDDCHPAFYLYILQHCYHAKIFFPLGQGAAHLGRWRLPAEAFNTFVAPVPSLPEQTKIAAFLDYETGKIDTLIAKQERLIALLEEKRQAVISRAVTKGLDPTAPLRPSGIDWLGDVPEHWEVLPLNRIVRDFVDYRGKTPTKTDEGVPLVTATQIKRGKIDHSLDPVFISHQEYRERMTRGFPATGDLLLTTEAPLGETALIEDPQIATGQRIILMKCNPHYVVSSYLLRHFQSQFGKAELFVRSSGSTASGIRADRLRASRVAIPTVTEQEQIVVHIEDSISKFEKLEQDAACVVTLLKERRTALISAAVTGKIDVRDWQPPQPLSNTDLSTETLQEAAL